MRFTWIPLVLALAAGQAFADDQHAPGAVDNLRVLLAAAESPGDAVSDAYLAKALAVALGGVDVETLDPALLAAQKSTLQDLLEKTAAAWDQDATVLGGELGCLPERLARPGCEQRLAQLEALAGDNAYHHVLLMGHAAAREDQDAVRRHARQAAEAPAYRHDALRVFGSLYQRFSQVPESLWPDGHDIAGEAPPAGVAAMAYTAALALPAYRHLIEPCKAAEGPLREDCLAIARKMVAEEQQGIDIAVAGSVLKAIGDASDREAARDAERRINWYSSVAPKFEEAFSREQWKSYYDLYAREGEMAAFAYAAAELGLPPEPPADWRR